MTPQFILDHCKRYGHLWGKEKPVVVSAWVKTHDGWSNPHNVTKTKHCQHCGKADVSALFNIATFLPSQKFFDLLEIKPGNEIYMPCVEAQS